MSIKLTGAFAGWKQHRCVGCGALYRYHFTVGAAVIALTPERREAKLRATLARLKAAALEWRACPRCGSYQPDMVAQRRRYWAGWTCLAVWLGLNFLVIISVQDHLTVPTLTWVAAGYWAVCAAVLAWTARRNFNADPGKNRDKAAVFTTAGTLRLDEPGKVNKPTPPPTGLYGGRAGPIFAAFLTLAVALPTLAEGMRRVAGWPLNPAFFPPVAGPGDQTAFHLPGTIRCLHGYWRGQAEARLLNAGELGLSQDELAATTNDYRWAKELSVSPNQPDYDVHPWVSFTLPADAKLAGQSARVELRLHAVFPQLSGQRGFGSFTFVTGERDLTARATLALAAPGAGRAYQWLWYGAMAGSGVLLTLAVRELRKSSRREGQSSQTGVLPPEKMVAGG